MGDRLYISEYNGWLPGANSHRIVACDTSMSFLFEFTEKKFSLMDGLSGLASDGKSLFVAGQRRVYQYSATATSLELVRVIGDGGLRGYYHYPGSLPGSQAMTVYNGLLFVSDTGGSSVSDSGSVQIFSVESGEPLQMPWMPSLSRKGLGGLCVSSQAADRKHRLFVVSGAFHGSARDNSTPQVLSFLLDTH